MKKKENDNFTTEARILLENVDFHMLVNFSCRLKGEKHLNETLLHNHVFYEFFLCKQGEICIKTAEEDILLKSGDVAIIPPSRSHVLKSSSENTEGYTIPFICKKINSDSTADIYKKLTPIINNKTHIFNNCQKYISDVEKIIESTLNCTSESFLTAFHFIEILFYLGIDKSKSSENTPPKKIHATSDEIERMMKLDSIISNRYLQKNTVADYAKELFISARQLDRLAIKRFGKSIHQLIVDNRFKLAEQLLITTNLTVEDIALRVGFSSSASLYKEFKKRKGVTPAVFRSAKEL